MITTILFMFQVYLCIFFHNICVKLQVDCFFLSFFPSSVFSPLASPLWTSLIVSLWLIWNDKASGVTYVCYRLLCHRMTCEGLLPPPSTVPLGETFWTIRISENTMGALTERRSRPLFRCASFGKCATENCFSHSISVSDVALPSRCMG